MRSINCTRIFTHTFLNLVLFGLLLLTSFLTQAQTPSALRQLVETIETGILPAITGELSLAPGPLVAFYRDNRHQPIWSGSAEAEAAFAQFLEAIESSALHGFTPARYHLNSLAAPKTDALTRELLATDAFLAQALHRQNGAVDPAAIDPEWFLTREQINVTTLLSEAMARGSVFDALEQLWPQHEEYRALLAKRAQLTALPNTETLTLPGGPALKLGMSDTRVVLLKNRLLGPGDHSPVFDRSLQENVQAFQSAAGLDTDGIVGTATLETLNATHFSWIDRIDANLERWRWLPDAVPDSYLRVNIAAFNLRAIRAGKDDYRMNVIVGRAYRRTPVFTETLKYLVYNPYWNLPHSIASKDKLPLLKQNAAAIEAQGYEARPAQSAEFIGVSRIDWQGVTPRNFNYALRQKPGPQNALGRIKFMLPNPYSVYLHDTPDHTLFAKRERGFSSGCVRLSDALGLAHWVLANDGQAVTPESIRQQIERQETTTVYLREPLPVLIVYLTAYIDEHQQVVFRRDLYQRDKAIIDQLRKAR